MSVTPKNKSFLVRGSPSRATDLQFDLLQHQPEFRFNIWEICISAVTIAFSQNDLNMLIGIKCNYIDQTEYLAIVNFSTKDGLIHTCYLPTIWYEVDFVVPKFEIKLIDLLSGEPLRDRSQFFIQIIYHRKS